MNIQITRLTGTTRHRKMLVTLGVGAIALAAVACGSSVSNDEAPAGDPPPEEVTDQSTGDLALGLPGGIGQTDDSSDTSAAETNTSASIGIIAPGTPLAPYDCDTGSTDPFTLYIEGEPVGDPANGKVIRDLSDPDGPVSLGMPVPDLADAVDEMIVLDENGVQLVQEVMDGSSLPMPVQISEDLDEWYVDGVEAPDAVSEPPSIEPTPISAPPSILPAQEDTNDVMPEPIAISSDDCGTSSSSDSDGPSTIEPPPVQNTDDLVAVEPTDDERAANLDVVEAPIESAGITVAESFPPQYMLWVVSGLSSAATTFGDYAVKRDGNVVAISIVNYVDPDVVAAQFYGIHQENIALGSEFTSGETYDVIINGRSWTKFTAQ